MFYTIRKPIHEHLQERGGEDLNEK